MKKLFSVLLILLLIVSVANAAPDFSDWTYDELIALQHYITAEIVGRPEWKEINVPSGEWIVGVDIPEGEYSIKPVKYALVVAWDTKNSLVENTVLEEGELIGKINLKSGYRIKLSDECIFTPAIVLSF